MLAVINDDDDDNDDERSTLEDVSCAKKWSTLEDSWPQERYNYKSADSKFMIIIPAIIIIIILIPGGGQKDDSSV